MEGNLDAHASLAGLCKTVFERTVACAGVTDAAAFVKSGKHFVLTAFPFDRQIARHCQMSYKLSPKPTSREALGIGLCQECSLSQFDSGRGRPQPGALKEGKMIKDESDCHNPPSDLGGYLNTGEVCYFMEGSFFIGRGSNQVTGVKEADIRVVHFQLAPELMEDDDEDDPNWHPNDDFECDKSKDTSDDAGEEAGGVACKSETSDGVRVKQETDERFSIEKRPSPKRSGTKKGPSRRGRPRLSQMTQEELEKWRSSKVSTSHRVTMMRGKLDPNHEHDRFNRSENPKGESATYATACTSKRGSSSTRSSAICSEPSGAPSATSRESSPPRSPATSATSILPTCTPSARRATNPSPSELPRRAKSSRLTTRCETVSGSWIHHGIALSVGAVKVD